MYTMVLWSQFDVNRTSTGFRKPDQLIGKFVVLYFYLQYGARQMIIYVEVVQYVKRGIIVEMTL